MRRAHVDPAILDAIRDGRVALPTEATHRFFRVLRLEAGSTVELFDGTGRIARGRLDAAGALVDIALSRVADPLPPLVVAQAVTKTDKLETVLQKGTELGASAFWLVASARSQVHLDKERGEKRRERLARVAEDAARQCGRSVVPQVEGPFAVDVLAQRVRAFAGVAVVGLLQASPPLSEVLAGTPERLASQGLLIIVGPEGGLDPREADALVVAGAHPVRLGAHVLRTETAALVGLAAAQVALGHL